MGEAMDKFLNTDIPEELYLSRNIQTIAARARQGGATNDELLKALVAIMAGNVMELEERLVALEKKAGVEPMRPRPIM
jgi:hypothetical protein